MARFWAWVRKLLWGGPTDGPGENREHDDRYDEP